MREWQSQAHVKWYCRYHVVIVPKYRRKSMFGAIRKDVEEMFRTLCGQFEVELVEGTPFKVRYLLNNSGCASMCGSLCTDEIGQGRNRLGGSHPVDEEFPEGNSKLITSLF
jgi:hypothetical protein